MSQDGQLALGDVEPTAMLRRVMPLDLGRNAMRFSRLEPLIQTGRTVRVQVVGDQDDLVGIWKVVRDQLPQLFRKVQGGPSSCHCGSTG